MPFDMNAFVNPNQFSDPATIIGFDKPMKGIREAMAEAAMAGATGGASAAAGGAGGAGAGAGGGGGGGGAGAGAAGGGAPVAPPNQSFGDAVMSYGKQAIAPYAQKFDQLSNAASQAAQGNWGNAFNAAVGKKIGAEPTVDANASSGGGLKTPTYEYSHVWDKY